MQHDHSSSPSDCPTACAPVVVCERCHFSKRACDGQTPCGRCVRIGKKDECCPRVKALHWKVRLALEKREQQQKSQQKKERQTTAAANLVVPQQPKKRQQHPTDDAEYQPPTQRQRGLQSRSSSAASASSLVSHSRSHSRLASRPHSDASSRQSSEDASMDAASDALPSMEPSLRQSVSISTCSEVDSASSAGSTLALPMPPAASVHWALTAMAAAAPEITSPLRGDHRASPFSSRRSHSSSASSAGSSHADSNDDSADEAEQADADSVLEQAWMQATPIAAPEQSAEAQLPTASSPTAAAAAAVPGLCPVPLARFLSEELSAVRYSPLLMSPDPLGMPLLLPMQRMMSEELLLAAAQMQQNHNAAAGIAMMTPYSRQSSQQQQGDKPLFRGMQEPATGTVAVAGPPPLWRLQSCAAPPVTVSSGADAAISAYLYAD